MAFVNSLHNRNFVCYRKSGFIKIRGWIVKIGLSFFIWQSKLLIFSVIFHLTNKLLIFIAWSCCSRERNYDLIFFIDFSPLDSTSENKRRNCISVKSDSTQAWTGGFLRDWQMGQPLHIGTYRIAKFWSFGISGQMACVRSFHHCNPNCYKKSGFIEIRGFNICFSWTSWIILINCSSWQRKGRYIFQSGHCCQPRNVFWLFQCKIGSATFYKTLDFDIQTNLSYFQLTTGLTSVNLALRFL